jgi:hypothetical protein
VSYVIDKAPLTPQEIDRRRGKGEAEKIAQVLRGPQQPDKPAPRPAAAAPPAPAKLASAVPLVRKSPPPASPKPAPPAPGAPLMTVPGMKPRPSKPADNKMGFASPPLQAKAGLRTETHVTLPKIAKRRRTRLFVSLIIFVILLGLGASIAYLIVTRTDFFKPEPVAQPILIETQQPTPESSPTPAPSPSPIPKETVTILETETGSLNVREEDSTATPVVARIAPGEEYELLEENEAGDWYKIQVDDETSGWIAARYATKNEEE